MLQSLMTGLAKSFNQINITTRRVIQMTFVTKQNAGLLKSARSWGALGLALALVAVLGLSEASSQISLPCQVFGAPAPVGNMVAWWPLDEQLGSTVVDLIGGNNGTTIGGPIGPTGPQPVTALYVGNSLRFFSPSRYVQVSANLNVVVPFTIDAWVRPQQGQQIEPIVAKLNVNAKTGYFLFIQLSRLYLQIGTGGTIITIAGPLITVGAWNFVAAVVNSTTVTLYVGVGTSLISGNPFPISQLSTTNTNPLHIGRSPYNPHPNGITIDEVEIFNRALSFNELDNIFKAGKKGKCKIRSDT